MSDALTKYTIGYLIENGADMELYALADKFELYQSYDDPFWTHHDVIQKGLKENTVIKDSEEAIRDKFKNLITGIVTDERTGKKVIRSELKLIKINMSAEQANKKFSFEALEFNPFSAA